MAVQVGAPISDVTDGSWLNELGTNTNLYASLDESVASDTDYIISSSLTLTTGVLRNAVAPGISTYDQAKLSGRLWTPAHLTTKPHAWYDAQDFATITAASGLVSQWSDK